LKTKIRIRNKFEARINAQLRRAKVEYQYESEYISYVLARRYLPDFPIITKSGKKIYIETKGHLRREDKAKLIAVKKQHPDIDLRIVFYSFNSQYVHWAEKHKFIYAIERIPKEWLI
jgi:hypothetical protein